MVYDYIIENFKNGEPIFLSELPGESKDYLRQEMKKLVDEGKLERLEKFYRYGLSQAGWNKYSYINLAFENQIICKKKQNV